jgi:hypothetical protein
MATFDYMQALESEIEKTIQAISEANIKLNTLRDLRRKYLDSQGARNVVPNLLSNASPNSASDNKTQLVLDIIRRYPSEGVEAGRVFKDLTDLGVSTNRNSFQGILHRLIKSGRVQRENGKYYPKMTASLSAPTGKTRSAT